MEKGKPYITKKGRGNKNYGIIADNTEIINTGTRYPFVEINFKISRRTKDNTSNAETNRFIRISYKNV